MQVYKITNQVNGKVYIGKTVRSLDARWRQHVSDAKRLELPLSYSISKHKAESFLVESLHIAVTKAILRKKCLRTGWKHSVQTRTKISKAQTGKVFTEEHRRISESKRGISLSPERKEARTKLLRGLKRTPEWRARISAALKGKKKSAEHRRHLSESRQRRLGT